MKHIAVLLIITTRTVSGFTHNCVAFHTHNSLPILTYPKKLYQLYVLLPLNNTSFSFLHALIMIYTCVKLTALHGGHNTLQLNDHITCDCEACSLSTKASLVAAITAAEGGGSVPLIPTPNNPRWRATGTAHSGGLSNGLDFAMTIRHQCKTITMYLTDWNSS